MGKAFILVIRAVKCGCCAHVAAICRAWQPPSHIMSDNKVTQKHQCLVLCSTLQVLVTHKGFFGMSTWGQNNPGSRLGRETNNIKINMSSLWPSLPQLLCLWQVPKGNRSPLYSCNAPATFAEQTHTSVFTLVICVPSQVCPLILFP